jgi:alpha-galactosidase
LRATFDAERRVWDLTWDGVLLRLRLEDGQLVCDHFGPPDQVVAPVRPLFDVDAVHLVRRDAGVQLAPGDQPVRWELADWSQSDPDAVVLRLRGHDRPIEARLRFGLDAPTGVLLRSTTLRHVGGGPPRDIAGATTAAVRVPPAAREVLYLSGSWGLETQPRRVRLGHEPLLLESRSGKTGFEYAPHVALLAPGHTYLCQLLWSGNWEIYLRRQLEGYVALGAGLNPWGLRHRLEAGDELALPDVLLACVAGDLNAATQRLHDWRRARRPDRDRPVPVQFNSWYPQPGEPPVADMKAFADTAAGLGCETFVLDAGWYTTETEDPSESWWLRTGDWVVSRRLYPNGLEELADHCRARGLAFGVWFEPEAISPSGVVRGRHPELLHHVGGRPPLRERRAILNLGVPAARELARERVLAVLCATGSTWMKWDFNTDLGQGGWADGLPEALTRQDPLIAHYRGLYRLQDELRAAIPGLTLEMCASGGGRFDGELLAHAHVNWMSDQTRPLANLAVHFGSQLVHPAVECNDWLIEWPPHDGHQKGQPVDRRGDLRFRTRVAMLGSFGVSAPVGRWSAEELEVVRQHVGWYKERVRPLVQRGDQYLLTEAPPADGAGDWAAAWYLSKDARQGALFAFRLEGHPGRELALPGLDPDARYRLTSPEGWTAERSGAELGRGLPVELDAPFRSTILAVEQT